MDAPPSKRGARPPPRKCGSCVLTSFPRGPDGKGRGRQRLTAGASRGWRSASGATAHAGRVQKDSLQGVPDDGGGDPTSPGRGCRPAGHPGGVRDTPGPAGAAVCVEPTTAGAVTRLLSRLVPVGAGERQPSEGPSLQPVGCPRTAFLAQRTLLPGAEWHQRWPALCCHPVPAPWRSDWAPRLGHGWLHRTWLHRCLPTFIHSFVHSAAAYSVLGSGLRTRLREFIHGQKKQASEPACHRDKTCVSQRQSAGSREKGS